MKPSETDQAPSRCEDETATGSLSAVESAGQRHGTPTPSPAEPPGSSHPPPPLTSPDRLRLFGALALALLTLAAATAALQSGSAEQAPAQQQREPIRHRLNVNAAEASSLELLSGIGPTLAERIITHRREHGRFRSPADLRDVRGIGPVTSEKMAPHIRFGPMAGHRDE